MAKKSIKKWEKDLEALNQLEDWGDLAEQAQHCIEDWPEKPMGYFFRGNAKSAFGQYDEAISDYDEAIRLDPRYANFFNNRGTAKSALEQYEELLAAIKNLTLNKSE